MPSQSDPTFRQIPWVDWPSCDPNKLGKRIDQNKALTNAWHCRRLSCPNCGPALITFRARNLLEIVRTEGWNELWWGVIDKQAVDAMRQYVNRNPETKRLLSIYFDDPQLRTVLATDNVLPRRIDYLVPLSIDEAVIDGWYKLAMRHQLRKMPHDDWNITNHRKLDWVDDGPTKDVVETDQRMDRIHGYIPGQEIDDTEEYKQRFRRIRRDLTDPPEPTYLDDAAG